MLKLITSNFYDRSVVLDWVGIDNEEKYKQNLLVQPQDWVWRTRSVRYSLNSQGFRAPEFDLVDWSNSVIAFGCSFTFGTGVDDQDTWPAQLSQLLGCPVINLAQGGTGWDFSWVNTQRVLESGIRPRAIIYYWPQEIRMFALNDPNNRNRIVPHGPWVLDQNLNTVSEPDRSSHELAQKWLMHPLISNFWAEEYLRSIKFLLSSLGIPQFHYTWDISLQSSLGLDRARPRYYATGDVNKRARDLGHFGPEDLALVAQHIYNPVSTTLR